MKGTMEIEWANRVPAASNAHDIKRIYRAHLVCCLEGGRQTDRQSQGAHPILLLSFCLSFSVISNAVFLLRHRSLFCLPHINTRSPKREQSPRKRLFIYIASPKSRMSGSTCECLLRCIWQCSIV